MIMVDDSASSTPYLPQELVDHIVDHLHDDSLTLSNCALVCHAWLPSSRLHLFSKISLNASSARAPTDLCKRLYHLLTASPSIISNIHELEVIEGSPLGGGQVLSQVALQGGSRSTTWVTTERTFPKLLRMLTHLKRLEFGAQLTPLYWSTLPPTLQHAISHVFSLPSLTYIRLKSWSFTNFAELAGLLACCRNLKGLSLSSTNVCNDFDAVGHPANGVSPVPMLHIPATNVGENESSETLAIDSIAACSRRCCLEFLTLDYTDFGYLEYCLLDRRSTVEIKSLRELRVAHYQPHDVNAIERLLVATGSSLEHFHLKPGTWEVHSFDLGLNSGLRSIRLTLEDPGTALAWVKTLVSSISPANVLERIGLEFYTDIKQLVEGWAELDSLLIRPELGGLRQVDIGLFAAPLHAEFLRVKEELGGLRDRNVLRMYQLGIKSQRSSRQLMPRISRYEYN